MPTRLQRNAFFIRRRSVSDAVPVVPVPVQVGLAAYWDFLDGVTLNGSNIAAVADIIGGRNVDQSSAGAQPADGGGYATNASGDYLRAGDDSIFNPGTGDFAAAIDIKTTSAATQVAFGTRIAGTAGTVDGWFIRTNATRFLEVIVDWGGAGGNCVFIRYPQITSGAWAHVLFTWESGSSTLTTYVDGVAQTPTTTFFAGTIGGGSVDPSTDLAIGAMPTPTQYWTGDLKGAGIWNRVPTAAEIAQLVAWETARR